jgi:hypothetical protein
MLLLLTSLLDVPLVLSDPEWRLAAFRVTAMAEVEGLDDPTATAAAVMAFGARLFVAVGETIAFGGPPALGPAFETGLSFLCGCSGAELNTVDELDEMELEAEMTGLVLSVCCCA